MLIGYETYFLREFSQNASLKAQNTVQASILVKHYQWELHCCKWKGGKCVKYCPYCEEAILESKNDLVIIQDYLTLYQSQELPGFKVVNRYQDTTYAKIVPSKANAQISSDSFSYEHYPWHYSLSYNHKPYYFLTIKAEPNNETFQQ